MVHSHFNIFVNEDVSREVRGPVCISILAKNLLKATKSQNGVEQQIRPRAN